MIRGGRRRLRNAILAGRILRDDDEMYRLALESLDKISDTEAVTLSLVLDAPLSKAAVFFSRLFEGYKVHDSPLYVGIADETQAPLPGGGYVRAFKLHISAYHVTLHPIFALRVDGKGYRYKLYLGRLNLAEGEWNPLDDMAAIIRERHRPGSLLAFLVAASHMNFEAITRMMVEEGGYSDESLGYRMRPGEDGSVVVCDLACSRSETIAGWSDGVVMLAEALRAAFRVIKPSLGEDELVRAIEDIAGVEPGKVEAALSRLGRPTLPALLVAEAGATALRAYTEEEVKRAVESLVKIDGELNVTVAGKPVSKPANIYRLARALELKHVAFDASRAPLHRVLALAAAGVYVPAEAAREIRRRIIRGETREVLKLPRSLVPRALTAVGLHGLLVEALARAATAEE